MNFKKILSLSLVVTSAFSLQVKTYAQNSFSDVTGHWAEEVIKKWNSKELVNGTSSDSFEPNRSITRAEYITIIARMFNLTEQSLDDFVDVKNSDWYHDSVLAAKKSGLVNGNQMNEFMPNANITRQDAMVILVRGLHLKANNLVKMGNFQDANKISEYAKEAVAALAEGNYIAGRQDNNIAPLETITRAEVVKLIDNILKDIVNKGQTVSQNVEGNVLVSSRDVILKDNTINGDLYISEAVADGDVALDNVTVNGNVFVRGGGVNTAKFINTKIKGNLVVEKQDDNIRILLEDTQIENLLVNSGVILDSDENSVFNNVVVETTKELTFKDNVTINNLTLNKEATIKENKSKIKNKIDKFMKAQNNNGNNPFMNNQNNQNQTNQNETNQNQENVVTTNEQTTQPTTNNNSTTTNNSNSTSSGVQGGGTSGGGVVK